MTTPTVANPEPIVDPAEPKPVVIGDLVPAQPVAEPSTTIGAPAETPAAPATPVTSAAPIISPATPAPLSEVAQLRQRLAQVEAERQEQATEATLVQEARTVQQTALARGLSDEDALWVAQQHYAIARRVGQQQAQLRQQQQYLRDKQDYAAYVAKQHGVDANLLMTADTPEGMVAIAEREKRYQAQDARLKALEQAQVSPQKLNNSSGSMAGNVALTADNIDKLWMDWEIAEGVNPTGRTNPYGAQYRRILGR